MQCEKGSVTISGSGGGYDGTNVNLEYSNGVTVNTTGVFGNLVPGQTYTFTAKKLGSNPVCDATNSIEVSINSPTKIEFENLMDGQTSSSGETDGIISLNYKGGTFPNTGAPNSTFSLEVINGNGANAEIDHSKINKEVRYTKLGVGTYRITIKDSNGCELSSENMEVTPAPTPVIGQIAITPISCRGLSDGEVSIPIFYGTNMDIATTIYYRLTEDSNPTNIITQSSTPLDNDATTNEEIEIRNLASGDYTIHISRKFKF